MSDQLPHDDELGALYRRLPADEPGAALDAVILAAARRRASDDARRTLLRRIRWSVPLAAAAGVVLTLSLTKLTPRETAVFELPPVTAPDSVPGVESGNGGEAAQDKLAASAPALEDSRGETAASPPVAPSQEKLRSLGYLRDDAPTPAAKGSVAPAAPTASGPAASEHLAAKDAAPAKRATVNEPRKKVERNLPSRAAAATEEATKESAPIDALVASPSAPQPSQAAGAVGAAASPPPGRPRQAEAPLPAAEAKAKPDSGALLESDAPSPDDDELDQAAVAEKRSNAAPALESAWPFGLEAGLGANEACRRVKVALHVDCAFRTGVADIALKLPATIEGGRLGGKRAAGITLTLRGGRLSRVAVRLVGSVTDELFLAR